MQRQFRAPLALLTALLLSPATASAEEVLNVMSYGGNYQKSQQVYFDKFTEETGVKVVVESADEAWPKVNAMVQAGNITWDVVQGETATILQNCDNGNLAPIDWSKLNKDDYIPIAVQKCGMGTIISSSVIAYNGDAFSGDKPQTVADFWDVKKFPGKRGMRKKAITTLEFALMADGVKAADVYAQLSTPEGVERAFKKLDEIKSNVVWWESSSSAPQLLGSGEVTMSAAWSGRVIAAIRDEKKNFVINWDGQLYDGDFFAIVKGSPHSQLALKFLAVASRPELQAKQMETIAYGPSVKKTLDLLPEEKRRDLPNFPANLATALSIDSQFWADRGEDLEARFVTWLGQ
jgi:putative spermidine/putrescine transport system substrate-binding protein